MPNRASRVRQLNEAAEWIVRLGASPASEDDVAEWLRWCDQEAGNLEAFEQLQGDWRDLGALESKAQASRPRNTRTARVALVALAAVMACVAIGLTLWWHREPAPEVLESTAHNREAMLPDGSSLVLSARSAVDINFTGRERRLSLSRGEAYFQVQHDARRPFIVQAGNLRVTAVGTMFDVRRDRDSIVVTVAEGTVGIVSDAGGEGGRSAHWQASAGYQLAYATESHTASLIRVNSERVLKWREGELAYISAPLATVVEDVNRYSDRHIIIKDPSIATLVYSGTVFTTSVEDWLKAVGVAYDLRVEETPGGDLVIEPSQN